MESLGPTGKFPHGKITPDDEGELKIGLLAKGGKIVLVFGKAVTWIGLPPEDAKKMAMSLLEMVAGMENAAKLRPEEERSAT